MNLTARARIAPMEIYALRERGKSKPRSRPRLILVAALQAEYLNRLNHATRMALQRSPRARAFPY